MNIATVSAVVIRNNRTADVAIHGTRRILARSWKYLSTNRPPTIVASAVTMKGIAAKIPVSISESPLSLSR